MYPVTTPSVGNPFNKIDFNSERHAYLEGLKFAGIYPSTGEEDEEEEPIDEVYRTIEGENRKTSITPPLLL